MSHAKSAWRCGHGRPASLSIAKSAEAANAGATQQSPKHRAQSGFRSGWAPSGKCAARLTRADSWRSRHSSDASALTTGAAGRKRPVAAGPSVGGGSRATSPKRPAERAWSVIDGHHDLADVRVGLHVAVGVDDVGQREGAVDDRPEPSAGEPGRDE